MNIEVSFREWIADILKTEQVSQSIIAYYFGIFQTTDGYSMYLIGSSEFDEDDDDWACNDDFTPSVKYLNLPSDEFAGLNWELVLKRIEEVITDFMESEEFKNSFLGKATAIATGFDDGDLIRLK